MRGSQFSDFFTFLIDKHVPARLYRSLAPTCDALEELKNVSGRDLEKWDKVHIQYLSRFESLALGIYHFHIPSRNSTLRSLEYLHNALNITSPSDFESRFLMNLAIGIVYFDWMLCHRDVNEQRKYLSLARFYLDEAKESLDYCPNRSDHEEELILMHKALVGVCRDDVPLAVRYITRASRVSHRPEYLYQILESIYRSLGLGSVAAYFSQKSKGHLREMALIVGDESDELAVA